MLANYLSDSARESFKFIHAQRFSNQQFLRTRCLVSIVVSIAKHLQKEGPMRPLKALIFGELQRHHSFSCMPEDVLHWYDRVLQYILVEGANSTTSSSVEIFRWKRRNQSPRSSTQLEAWRTLKIHPGNLCALLWNPFPHSIVPWGQVGLGRLRPLCVP